MSITNAVSLPKTSPVVYLDPVTADNKVTRKIKIIDHPDLAASFSTAPSVNRSATAPVIATVTNQGADPVVARITIKAVNATTAGVTPDSGLTCAAPVTNSAGTGFSVVCTSNLPLAPGSSLSVAFSLVPNHNPAAQTITLTGTVAGVGGTIIDANPANNSATAPVTIINA
jgi:hypothetical protein